MRYVSIVTIYIIALVLTLYSGLIELFFTEFILEGLALFSTAFVLILNININKLTRNIIPILLISFLVVFNFIIIIYESQLFRLFFLYPLFLIILLFCFNFERINLAANYLSYVICGLLIASSVYAVFQRLGLQWPIPLETDLRATGFSRSSLALSATLSMGLFLIRENLVGRNALTMFISFVLYAGIVAAGGRGAMMIASVYILIEIIRSKNYLLLSIFIVAISFVIFYDISFLTKAFSVFNFSSDLSNVQRFEAYTAIFNEFTILGSGVGLAGPAVSRFTLGTGFESTVLNYIFEFGIMLIVLVASFIIFIFNMPSLYRQKILWFFVFLSPLLFGQQMFNTPSVFCILILVMSLLRLRRF